MGHIHISALARLSLGGLERLAQTPMDSGQMCRSLWHVHVTYDTAPVRCHFKIAYSNWYIVNTVQMQHFSPLIFKILGWLNLQMHIQGGPFVWKESLVSCPLRLFAEWSQPVGLTSWSVIPVRCLWPWHLTIPTLMLPPLFWSLC